MQKCPEPVGARHIADSEDMYRPGNIGSRRTRCCLVRLTRGSSVVEEIHEPER
jgi:hypothetical protein